MAAYVISDVEFVEPSQVERYRLLAPAAIAKYGGRYLARGGPVEPVEGDWRPERIIVVEFSTMEQAREWYRSPEYADALAVRRTALKRNLIFVDGVPPEGWIRACWAAAAPPG
jgi:uncharacterized protein (DUF1330 family)